LSFQWPIWRDILRESWPIGVAVIFNLIYLKGDVILLSTLRTQTEVGLYGAAYKVLDVVTVIPYIFMGLVLPLMSAAWSRDDKIDFNRKLSLAFDALAILAIPLMFGAFAIADDLIAFVAGAEFTSAGQMLTILMVGGFAVFWHALYNNALVAMGQQKKMVLFYALNAAISVGLYLLLIPTLGGLGAALVTAFSELFIAVIATIIVTSACGFKPRWQQLRKIVIASMIMFGALYLWPEPHVLWRVSFGMVIYTLALLLMRGLPIGSLQAMLIRNRQL
jgi:O-antigen/teichoic acid export membrane protein